MEATLQTNTKEILDHHLSAFVEADVVEIMKDFSEASELLTPQGPVSGLSGIRSFFEQIFDAIPKGSALEIRQETIRDNVAYVVWACESPYLSIPMGMDTFIMEDGKIIYQALAAHLIPK